MNYIHVKLSQKIQYFSSQFFKNKNYICSRIGLFINLFAQVAELVDAPASGAGDRKVVEVRVLSWAPQLYNNKLSTII